MKFDCGFYTTVVYYFMDYIKNGGEQVMVRLNLRLGYILLLFTYQTAFAEEYIFTATPQWSAAKAGEVYQPIADYLSRVTGKKIVYVNSDNWLTYISEMQKDKYDLVFDGPHFGSWRIHKLKHVPLVKLPQPHIWDVVIRADNINIKNVKSLAGRPICAHAPPNFGTLTLLSLFDNPARQPFIMQINGWKSAFDGVVQGKCMATILPLTNLKQFDPEMKQVKLLYQHRPFPNQLFTASSRFSPEMHAKIIKALLSDEGKAATQKLMDEYAKGRSLVLATKEEYADIELVLKNERGFEF